MNNNPFDVYAMAMFGLVGYVLIKLDFEPAPLLLGFVLGPMLEENLRRAMIISRGDATVFLTRPLSLALLALAVGVLVVVLLPTVRAKARGGLPGVDDGDHRDPGARRRDAGRRDSAQGGRGRRRGRAGPCQRALSRGRAVHAGDGRQTPARGLRPPAARRPRGRGRRAAGCSAALAEAAGETWSSA